MKIFILTDMEGTAGVLNSYDWIYRESKYLAEGKRLVSEEVNAAVRGFAAGGFDEIVVYDGHGFGAIEPELLDKRATYMRGYDRGPDKWNVYPFAIDKSFDALAITGQHAKPGTPYSHLTHNMWWNFLDSTVNGVSIGEYGMMVLSSGELGIPVIFASGEQALADEASALTPWVVTAAVKKGLSSETGENLDAEQWEACHQQAEHMDHEQACKLIEKQAKKAAEKFCFNREAFKPLQLKAPYTMVTKYRPSKDPKSGPARTVTVHNETSVSIVMNDMFRASEVNNT